MNRRNIFKEFTNEVKYLFRNREPPTCINCKHFMEKEKVCTRFHIESYKYLIYGTKQYLPVGYMRESYCSYHGHYFEEKKEEKSVN